MVHLVARAAAAVAEAERMGAGIALCPDDAPADVVVIATPPSAVVGVLRDAQRRGLGAVYTDVASAKARILDEAASAGCDLATYVPGHPMAGRELSGPAAGRADLFGGRKWVLCPGPATLANPVHVVAELAAACGAEPLVITPDAHDRIVAVVSHVPHLVSSAIAARLVGADETALSLVGQGLR